MSQVSSRRDESLVIIPRRRQKTPPRTKYVVLFKVGNQNVPVAYTDAGRTAEMSREARDEINRFIQYVQMIHRLVSAAGGGRIHVQMSSLLPVSNGNPRVYVPDDVSVTLTSSGYEITVAPLREVKTGLRLVTISRNGRRIDEFLVSAWNTYEALKHLLAVSQAFAPTRRQQSKVDK